MFSLILLLSPRAAQAQSFSNVQGNIYRTTVSGSVTEFGALLGQTNGSLDPTVAGGDYFNTNVSNFGLPPGTPFGAIWTGSFYAPYSGTYTFNITADDGFRFYLTNGGAQVASFLNWNDSSPDLRTYQVTLTANTTYAFRLEYYENGVGGGQISLGATATTPPLLKDFLIGQIAGYVRGEAGSSSYSNDWARTYDQTHSLLQNRENKYNDIIHNHPGIVLSVAGPGN